ncbi:MULTISPECIES: flagellar hook protein FlgE [unclassified Escherichia]|uniref:flagellar hook protein FlgE n=1 Tax=unclassified Escherichia TaxID=2608889 RepID=UPI001081A64E|nr:MULTISPECIES: flagellar hook protein FlgE [unclassified Escherichia]TGB97296.1 flagellar biosynthesis protein FlgE [Escherichia sp. E2748]TGC21327.1 flagellar biosynthesis protein FlgE [Escherichia sp. E1130]TLI73256.1 flagellar hook protein FlgE [Escherichia sp. E1130]TLI85188.1 flagellar hook protein FlgE [Escherichia sp. E2748]
MSFSQGLSGLNAASQALDVVGNNIANSQTVGFKSGSISFADVFAGSQIGMGVQVAGVDQNFSDGVLGAGASPLDMGIQGNGFFRMETEAGKIFYSRNGQFKTDANGYIVNSQGMQLCGYKASGEPPTIPVGSPVEPLQIPTGAMSAKASNSGSLSGNLNSGSKTIDQKLHPFSITDSASYNYSTQVNAYDSQGNEHEINVYFVKTADNKWSVYSDDHTAPSAAAPQQLDITFDSSGKLNTIPANLKVDGASFNGAAPLNFDLNLDNLSQQASDNSMDSPVTTGYAPGTMTGYVVGDNGQIVASYSNGQQQLLGQVVLANFTNPGGLQAAGNNCWSASPESGQPVVGISDTGNLGTLRGNVLEASNVDLSKEMVNMIVYQRNYQSNSQTIKTQSEVLQTLVNLG